MSRCFPFPPPGYERKARNNEVDLLEKRVSGKSESHGGEKFIQKDVRDKDISADKKLSTKIGDNIKAEKLTKNSNGDDESKVVQEFARRTKEEATGIDGQGTRDVTRPGGNAMVQNTTGMVQTKFESLPRLLDKSGDTKMDELDTLRESNKQNLNNHTIKTAQLPNDSNNNGVPVTGTPKKRKEIETNGVAHAHDNLPGKLPRPASSSSYSSRENGRILEPCQISADVTDRKGGSNNLKMESKDKSDRKGASNNLKMDNKDRKINGVIETHPLSVSTMKLKSAKAVADPIAEASSVRPPDTEARPSSVSHNMKLKSATAVADPIAEALVKPLHPEAQQPSSASPKKPKSATVAADPISETLARPPHTEAKPLSVSPMKPKSAPPPPPPPPAVDPIAEALARPPHPDSKYISQIYSVPNREEWSDHSDDEWLFDIKASETTKKAKLEPSTVEETPQVWSEAQQIESADILALPYVIPY
uniref:Uncharacterized protein n=1 Tax=Cannabis sativa TaxID=3483 RepID=A0A803Q1G4_CANSA